MLHNICIWLSIAVGLLSAALWLNAALIRVPTERLGSGFGALVGVDVVAAELRRQTAWNSWAAGTAGAAALFQAVATLTAP